MSNKNQPKLKFEQKLEPIILNKLIEEEIDRIKPSSKKNPDKKLTKSEANEKQRQEMAKDQEQMEQFAALNKYEDEKRRLDEEKQLKDAIERSKQTEEFRKKLLKQEEERKVTEERKRKLQLHEELQQKLMSLLQYSSLYDYDYRKIENCLNDYERNSGNLLNDFSNVRSSVSLNGKSALILDLIKVLRYTPVFNIEKIIQMCSSQLETVRTLCQNRSSLFIFNPDIHRVDKTSMFTHNSLDDKLKVIEIRGDGNCLWNSISTALFGDHSMMESLRLLTASTFIENKELFENYFIQQKNRYGYNPELNFDGLVNASVELQVWGDEHHILALSLALNRPIHSYGSLFNFEMNINYEEFKKNYESDSLPNHFKYIADELYENKTPILLFYDGESHYNVVLPTDYSVVPPVPKSQVLDPIIERKIKHQVKQTVTEQHQTEEELSDKTEEIKLKSSENKGINKKSFQDSCGPQLSLRLTELSVETVQKTLNEMEQIKKKLTTIEKEQEVLKLKNISLKHKNHELEEKVLQLEKQLQSKQVQEQLNSITRDLNRFSNDINGRPGTSKNINCRVPSEFSSLPCYTVSKNMNNPFISSKITTFQRQESEKYQQQSKQTDMDVDVD